MGRFYIKQNDTSPAKNDILTDDDDDPVDIASADVDFHMVDEDGNTVVDKSATNEQDGGGDKGEVSYQWSQSDTSTAGEFEAEWEVTYSSGAIETFPNSANLIIVIEEELA